jgi:GLPGLI family protein
MLPRCNSSFDLKSTNMKRIYILGCALLAITTATAQQKEGKVIYERTSQTPARSFSFNGMTQEIPAATRKDKFELSFGNDKSLWKQADPENNDETISSGDHGGSGFTFRSVVAGSNDVVFSNFAAAKRIEKREIFDKTFVIEDSVRPLKWKMTGETKMILNHPCMKATATNITQRTTMTMEDGKMERKEVADTANIIAWFASDIPVSAGPGEYQAQLPGLIMEMDISNGRQLPEAG